MIKIQEKTCVSVFFLPPFQLPFFFLSVDTYGYFVLCYINMGLQPLEKNVYVSVLLIINYLFTVDKLSFLYFQYIYQSNVKYVSWPFSDLQLGCPCFCLVQCDYVQPLCLASNLAIFSQVPLACAGRVLGADFCPNLEEIDQRLEIQVGVLLFYQLGMLCQKQGPLQASVLSAIKRG